MYDFEGEKKFRVITVGQEAEKKYIAKIKMQEAPGWEICISEDKSITFIIRNKLPSNPENLVYFSFMKSPPLKKVRYHERFWQITRNINNGVMKNFIFDKVEEIQSNVYRCFSGKKVIYIYVIVK